MKNKNTLYLFTIIVVLFYAGCKLEQGNPLFSLRDITATTMVTQDSAYLFFTAQQDTATYRGLEYAEIAVSIAETLDSMEIVAYGHCWLENQTEPIDTNIMLYPTLADKHTMFTIGADTVEASPSSALVNDTSQLHNLQIDHQYFVRSYIITKHKHSGRVDTGYNQITTKFWTRIPEDVWFYQGDIENINVREEAASFVLTKSDGTELGFYTTGYGTYGYSNDTWCYDYTTNTWSNKAGFTGSERESAVAFSIVDEDGFNYGYVGTGYNRDADDEYKYKKDFWRYNLGLDGWQSVAPMGSTTERANAVAFTLTVEELGIDKQYGYVSLGENAGAKFNDLYQYDIEDDSWTPRTNFEYEGRSEAVAATINGEVAIVGSGTDANGTYLNTFCIYREGHGWNKINPCPEGGRANAVAFALSYERNGANKNMFYMVTGRAASGTLLNTMWAYDYNSGEWIERSEIVDTRTEPIFAIAREGAVAFSIVKGHVEYGSLARGFVVTGRSTEGTSGMTKFWEYLP